MSQYNRSNARVAAQKKRMESLEARGICAFCRENLESETTSPIELETEHWVVKANDYPYDHTKHHILLIPKVHKSTVADLPTEVQADFMPTVAKVEKRYKFDSFAVAFRSGDITKNGSTVEHLHAHIIVGDTDDPNHQPVRFKVSEKPKK